VNLEPRLTGTDVKRPDGAALLLAASFIAMFGGALRIGAEVVARLLPADFGDLLTPYNVGLAIFIVTVLGVAQILLWRWPWSREQMRLNREGIRALYGLPPPARPLPLGRAIRRIAPWSALLVFPSVLVGIMLPGPAAAACAILAGVVLRVADAIVVDTAA
jgi:hypothetical protein